MSPLDLPTDFEKEGLRPSLGRSRALQQSALTPPRSASRRHSS